MSILLDLISNPWQAVTAILALVAAFFGVKSRYHKGQAKKHKKAAQTAEKEVRRRVLVQKADQRVQQDLEEKRDEVAEANRNELIDRLTNR